MENYSSPVNNVTTNSSLLLQYTTEVMPENPQDTKEHILVVFDYINYVYLPTVLIVGLVGNIFTIAVMMSRNYSQTTSRIYLIALAISDTILLCAQPFNKSFFIKMVGYDLKALTDVGCKIYFIIRRSSKMTSSWFVVLLCIERFIAVWFPFKAKIICTAPVSWLSVTCVYVIMISFTSSWTWASKITSNGKCYPDVYDKNNPGEVEKFGNMLKAGSCLYSIIPMVVLSTLSVLIVVKLARHSKQRQEMSHSVKKQKSAVESSKITTMLLGIVIAYIVLVLPITILHNAAYELKLNTFANNSVGFEVFKQVAQILEQMNYSINFFLYVMTSQKFRKTLASLIPMPCVCLRSEKGGNISKRTSTKISNIPISVT